MFLGGAACGATSSRTNRNLSVVDCLSRVLAVTVGQHLRHVTLWCFQTKICVCRSRGRGYKSKKTNMIPPSLLSQFSLPNYHQDFFWGIGQEKLKKTSPLCLPPPPPFPVRESPVSLRSNIVAVKGVVQPF